MKEKTKALRSALTPMRVGILLFVLLFAGLWLVQARGKDTYTNILIAAPVGDFDGKATDQSAFAGEAVYFDEVDDLYPGTYHLEVNYRTTGKANYIEYLDLQTGEVLAGGTFAPEGTYWDADVTLARRVDRLGIRSYLEDGTLWVDSCYITSAGPVYTDTFWGLAVLVLLGGIGFVLLRQFRAGNRYGMALFCAALVVSLPFVSDHLQKGHDLGFHLSRITGIASALLHGQFPVRLSETMLSGSGYLSSVMYPELFLYFPGILCAAGASVLCAFKLFCLFLNLLTALAGYQGMRRIFGDKIGFAFALLYLLNPLRLDELFMRAAIGEALAMAFLPLAAAGLYDLMQGDARRGFWEAVFGITGVFQSHLISTLLLIFFGGCYVVIYLVSHLRVYFSQLRRPAALCAAAVSTVLVNCWFLVPFLSFAGWDMGVYHDKRPLAESAIAPFQAFMDLYHYGADLTGSETADEMSHTIGFALLAAAVLFVLLCLAGRMETDLRKKGTVCLLVGFAAWFMSTSLFPWDAVQCIPLFGAMFGSLQYAWRFLVVAACMLTAVAAAVLVALLEQKHFCAASVLAVLAVSAAVACCSGYLMDNGTQIPGKCYSAWEHNAVYDGQYLLYSSDTDAVLARTAESTVLCSASDVTLSDLSRRGLNLSFSFENPAGDEITFQLPFYNYGLTVIEANGTRLAPASDENGMLLVTVPAGQASGTVTVRYHERMLFRLAELITLVSAIGLAAGEILRRRKGHTPAPQPDKAPAR